MGATRAHDLPDLDEIAAPGTRSPVSSTAAKHACDFAATLPLYPTSTVTLRARMAQRPEPWRLCRRICYCWAVIVTDRDLGCVGPYQHRYPPRGKGELADEASPCNDGEGRGDGGRHGLEEQEGECSDLANNWQPESQRGGARLLLQFPRPQAARRHGRDQQ
jgi:hypothetical protein